MLQVIADSLEFRSTRLRRKPPRFCAYPGLHPQCALASEAMPLNTLWIFVAMMRALYTGCPPRHCR